MNAVTAPVGESGADESAEMEALRRAARRVLRARRALDRHLPAELIQNPALELLATLFGEHDGAPVEAAALMRSGAAGSAVTARWITALGHHGLLRQDGGQVRLTAIGTAAMASGVRAMIEGAAADAG